MDELIPDRQKREWKSKEEFIKYGRAHGYDKLSRAELQDRDSGYYGAGMHHKEGGKGWMDELIPDRQRREWKSKEEFIKYGRAHGYDKLSRAELRDRDSGYYGAGMHHKEGGKRWMDELIPRKIRTDADVKRYISRDPTAKRIVEIASLNQSYSEVAEIFTQLWPDKFPSSEKLAQQLPKVISKVSHAISPLMRFEAAFKGIYEFLPVEFALQNLQDMLYRIGIDVYQAAFNNNPKETLARLKRLQQTIDKKNAQKVIRGIHSWYKDAYQFTIPGIGNISQSYS
ncbi:MAG: hypothetical protein HY514_03090 [Candidatus Aenigmarchaeota archaeon]|nr:hypothetical protein [Candidatus Aenigmarchaeota archaeon]